MDVINHGDDMTNVRGDEEEEETEEGEGDDVSLMEIEVNRNDFRGILRELRTLSNVIIDSIVDGTKEHSNSDFDRLGKLKDFSSADFEDELPSVFQPKQELRLDDDGEDAATNIVEEGRKEEDVKRLQINRVKINGNQKKKNRWFPLRKYGVEPSPSEPSSYCRVILHPINDDLLSAYLLLRRGQNKEKRHILGLINDDMKRWLKRYRHLANNDHVVDKSTERKRFGTFVKAESCPICLTFSSANRDAMEKHKEESHELERQRVRCHEQGCDELVLKRHLGKHVDVVHRGLDTMTFKEVKKYKKKSACSLCVGTPFMTRSEPIMARHKEKEHNVFRDRVPCPEDGCERHILKDKIPFHLRNFHSKGGDVIRRCELCEFTTGHLTTLRRHYKTQHPGAKVSMPRPKVVNRKPYVGVASQRNHICDQCGYSTTTTHALDVHVQRVHLGLRPFACDQCDKKFLCSNDLKSHKARKHDGIKNYICDECSYQCPTRYELKAHKTTIHGGEWNFRCTYEGCPFGAHQLKKLEKHVDSVHKKIMKYKCPDCPKTASEKGNVLTHWRQIHRGIRRYTCNLCKYGSEKRNRLITHLSLDHNIDVKVVDKKLICSRPDCLTIYSSENDPLFKQLCESIEQLSAESQQPSWPQQREEDQ